jgi:hypothetical protein
MAIERISTEKLRKETAVTIGKEIGAIYKKEVDEETGEVTTDIIKKGEVKKYLQEITKSKSNRSLSSFEKDVLKKQERLTGDYVTKGLESRNKIMKFFHKLFGKKQKVAENKKSAKNDENETAAAMYYAEQQALIDEAARRKKIMDEASYDNNSN